MKSISDYYDGKDRFPKGSIKISPSSLGKFFSQTSQWYRETLLGEDGFQGSTATILGTIVHFAAETRKIPSEAMVLEYISKQKCEYDLMEILDNYVPMCEVIITNIMDSYPKETIIREEEFINIHLKDIVHVGGTYDAIYETTEYVDENGEVHTGNFTVLRDYKTAAQKPSYGFTRDYSTQLLTYVCILKELGITIDAIELKYITKPTKTLPARIFTFVRPVTIENLEYIDSVLELVANSILSFIEYPHLRGVIAQDGRLTNTQCKYTTLKDEEEI